MKKRFQVIIFMMVVLLLGSFACKQTYAQSGKRVNSITITVNDEKVNSKTISLENKKSITLKVSCLPAKAKKSVTFKSSKKDVASVNSRGKVVAKKAGKAKITVTVTGKDKKKKVAWVKIAVKDDQPKNVFIANRNSGKLHYYTCKQLPYYYNRIYFDTKEDAYAAGYTDEHKECMENR